MIQAERCAHYKDTIVQELAGPIQHSVIGKNDEAIVRLLYWLSILVVGRFGVPIVKGGSHGASCVRALINNSPIPII
jgi:hypothetical protein